MSKILVALFMVSSFAMAATVEITSLVRVNRYDQRDDAVEVCGRVHSSTQAVESLKVIADGNTNNPGIYWAFAGGQGPTKTFCHLIAVFGNTVEVQLGDSTARKSLK